MKDHNHSTKKGVIRDEVGKPTVEVTSFESIIPDPETLQKLESICPGATQMWMDLAKSQIQANQKNDSRITWTFKFTAIMGILAALISVTLICLVGFYALYKGYATQAAYIITGSAASVITAFLIRRGSQNRRQEVSKPTTNKRK